MGGERGVGTCVLHRRPSGVTPVSGNFQEAGWALLLDNVGGEVLLVRYSTVCVHLLRSQLRQTAGIS